MLHTYRRKTANSALYSIQLLVFIPEVASAYRAVRNGSLKKQIMFFDVLLTVRLSIFISVINQLDAQNFCFTIILFHASTCFKHMCSSSGGQNCITQPLVSSQL